MDSRDTPPIFRRRSPVPPESPQEDGAPQARPTSLGAPRDVPGASASDAPAADAPAPEPPEAPRAEPPRAEAPPEAEPPAAEAPPRAEEPKAEEPAAEKESAEKEPGSEEAVLADAEEIVEEAEQVLLDDFNKLAAERDDYLDQLRRTRADFENFRKRMHRQQSEQRERAAEDLVEKLLPVLDTFEQALAHGQGFDQVQASLMTLLEKEGLERIHPLGKPFDPSEADAVAHEEGDEGPVVAEVLRPGYRWKGRVVRPAMVRVRG